MDIKIYDWDSMGDFQWLFNPDQYDIIRKISKGIIEIGIRDFSDDKLVNYVIIDAYMRGKRIEQEESKSIKPFQTEYVSLG